MVTAYVLLRVLVTARQIKKALEKGNEIAEARLQLEKDRLAMQYPAWYKAGSKVPSRGRVSIETANREDWETRNRELNPDAEDRLRRP